MQILDINEPGLMDKVVVALKAAQVVMHPTETCYGLAVDVFNKQALEKLYAVKQMSLDKPVSVLVDSLRMAQDYGVFSDKAMELARKYWPGPLSIVVPRKNSLPIFLNKDNDYISFRCSSDPFSAEMVKTFGRPISTTSANKTGEPQMYLPDNLPGVDLLVDGGEIPFNRPSTIVRVDGDMVQILRQGGLEIE